MMKNMHFFKEKKIYPPSQKEAESGYYKIETISLNELKRKELQKTMTWNIEL